MLLAQMRLLLRAQQQPQQQRRCYAVLSRKDMLRASLWRGKKELGLEAQQAVTALRCANGNPDKVADVLKKRVSRLIKIDHLAVIVQLQDENEVDLALKVFEEARKDSWYKPSVPMYRDMLKAFARNRRVEDVQSLLEQMKTEKLEYEMVVFVEIVENFIGQGMYDAALHFFEQMKASECPPNTGVYRTIINCFKKREEVGIASRLQQEMMSYIKARYGAESFPPCRARSAVKKNSSSFQSFRRRLCSCPSRSYSR